MLGILHSLSKFELFCDNGFNTKILNSSENVRELCGFRQGNRRKIRDFISIVHWSSRVLFHVLVISLLI